MAIHYVRDYLTQNLTVSTWQNIPGYILGIFLRRVLLYTYVGDTNYPINPVGTLLISTADSTPTAASPTFAVGTRAGINQGTGREFYVWIPPATRVVSAADVGRLISLRSTANPAFNSGVYLITGFEALNLTVQTTSGNLVSPIQVTTTTTNNLTTGQTVTIQNVVGNTAANGTFTITVLNNTQFTLNGTTGNGNYVSGGTVQTNTYIIDYRTMGSLPPQEPFDSMNWYLYASDANAPLPGNPNGGWPNNYGGNGTSSTPRIIMQSPHPLGYQVRLCHETVNDFNLNNFSNGAYGAVPPITCIPGFSGTVAGDFAVGGPHLHTALWYFTYAANSANTIYHGATPGFGDTTSSNGGLSHYPSGVQYRITMVGDDGGQACAVFVRREFDATNPKQQMLIFGIPDNEPTPLPTNNVSRLFCIGSGLPGADNNTYGNNMNDISWSMGPVFFTNGGLNGNPWSTGVSQSLGGIPIASSTALWTYVANVGSLGNPVGQFGSPIFDGSAGDSPWLNATELSTVDIVNGTIGTWNGTTGVGNVFPLEPRIIGTVPLLRAGRANFGEFALTTDATHNWQHMRRGVFMIWNGPVVVP